MTALDPLAILSALARHGVDYVLIGQAAAVIWGHPETTMDVDVVARQEVDNAERLVSALHSIGARHRATEGPGPPPGERDFIGQRLQLSFDTDAGQLDVLPTAAGVGGYEEFAERATRVDISGVEVLVASLDDVIASKEAAGRPKDLARLARLRALRDRLREAEH